ncbi:uncharacterized protein LOC107790220 [Nicotiana tabacum]|uniref:Uncharacterized protein LOC107790220 n=1 Tax=Nicotiana tabacum TaxID=4097 RepID=A0AC58UCN9_TOBAC
MIINPLIQATKLGITELVTAILKARPQVSDSLDENGRNILHIAVERKHLRIYEYLKKKLGHDKDRMLAEVDKYGNNILHLASSLGIPSTHSSVVPVEEFNTDIAREMCWDIYWLKHTRMDCHPHLRYVRNRDGKTADELFEENHLRLRKAAQRESIEMINSIIVVATLLCTVNYAALFTLPGGFDQNSGVAVLDKDNTFYKFIVVVYSAIFFSFISLAALLSLQRSAFYAEEFYISLPLKASIASICLMLAAVFTITASALALVLENKRVNVLGKIVCKYKDDVSNTCRNT